MKDVGFICVFGYIFYGHFGIEEFIELGIALLVVIDSFLPKISTSAVFKILVAPSSKVSF